MRVNRLHILAAVGSVALLVSLAVLRPGPIWHRSLPNFQKMEDISERKVAFFNFLVPYIEEANGTILQQRRRLKVVRERLELGSLNRRDAYWLESLAEKQGVDMGEDPDQQAAAVEELLFRVDIIPPSLALAQAALESGWGTSRFAQKGNNLFGIWCYERGCGIIPRHRPAGATYEVASYSSPNKSFLDYISSLNGSPAYRPLWSIRQQARLAGRDPSGYQLAGGLIRYSEEREAYIAKVRRVIQSNQLARFD